MVQGSLETYSFEQQPCVVIGVRALKFVHSQLHHPMDSQHFWTDSSMCAVLADQQEVHVTCFVENRLKGIRSHDDLTFHYVPTQATQRISLLVAPAPRIYTSLHSGGMVHLGSLLHHLPGRMENTQISHQMSSNRPCRKELKCNLSTSQLLQARTCDRPPVSSALFHMETTTWCSEIGSLTSLDAPELHASVTSENQFHCTRLYKVLHSHPASPCACIVHALHCPSRVDTAFYSDSANSGCTSSSPRSWAQLCRICMFYHRRKHPLGQLVVDSSPPATAVSRCSFRDASPPTASSTTATSPTPGRLQHSLLSQPPHPVRSALRHLSNFTSKENSLRSPPGSGHALQPSSFWCFEYTQSAPADILALPWSCRGTPHPRHLLCLLPSGRSSLSTTTHACLDQGTRHSLSTFSVCWTRLPWTTGSYRSW